MSGVVQALIGSASVPPPPTLSLNASVSFTAGSNVNVAIGTYTGVITNYTINQGSVLQFISGTVYWLGNISYSANGSTLNVSVSNAGGSASGSTTLNITAQTQTYTLTNWSFPVNVEIATFSPPRKTIVSGTSSITSGVLATGSLPPGVSVQVNQGGNGDIVVTGTPSVIGTYNSTWTCNGPYVSGATTTGTVTLTIT